MRIPNRVQQRPLTGHVALALAALTAFAFLGVLGSPTTARAANEGSIQFGDNEYVVAEGHTAFIQLKRTGGGNGTQRVHYSIGFTGTATPADIGGFNPSINGAVDFPNGCSPCTRTIDDGSFGSGIDVTDDGTAEGTENVDFAITSIENLGSGADAAIGTQDTTTLTIIDEDSAPVFQFSQDNYNVAENAGHVTVTVERSGLMGTPVSVHYNTLNDSAGSGDYTGIVDNTLSFSSNQTSKTFNVNITNDATQENDEEFILQLDNPSDSGTVVGGDSTVTILANDGAPTVSFSQADYEADENDGSIVIHVVRNGDDSDPLDVDYDVTAGTATSADFTATSGTLHFVASDDDQTFSITIKDDVLADGTKTVLLELSNPDVGTSLAFPSEATLTIFDDESSSLSVTQLNPDFGPTIGGNTVEIVGTGFSDLVEDVTFGGVTSPDWVVVDATHILAEAPAHIAATVSVRVTTSAGTTPDTAADNYQYTDGPVILSLNPTTAPAGSTTFVQITGLNFTGVTAVLFGATSATFAFNDDSHITAVTPTSMGAGVFDVRVVVGSETSPVTPADEFTFTSTSGPTVTALNPTSTPINIANTTVTITGTNFITGATVTFGGVAATNVLVVNGTTITAKAPSRATAGTVDVVVTTTLGSSPTTGSGNDFTYTGPGGATVTYTLYFRWSLFPYTGKTMDALAALNGLENPDNPATNDVSGRVTAIFRWSPNGDGCDPGILQCWLAFFPSGVGVPGANDFSTLTNSLVYWWAVTQQTSWTVLLGP